MLGTFIKRVLPTNKSEIHDEIHQLLKNGVAIFEKIGLKHYGITHYGSLERTPTTYITRNTHRNRSQIPDEIAMLRDQDYVLFRRTMIRQYGEENEMRHIPEEILEGNTPAGYEISHPEIETNELDTISISDDEPCMDDDVIVISDSEDDKDRCVCCG